MERALWSAASGMKAQELSLDTISNNLANATTAGFKASRVSFQDMLYSVLTSPGATSSSGTEVPNGIQIGHGVRVAEISRDFRQGSLKDTGRELDLAVEGEGFFEVILPDGSSAYTRDGSFRKTSTGQVVTVDGYRVNGFDTVEQDATNITITADGAMSTLVNGVITPKTRVTLTRFTNPEGLRSLGRNMYKPSDSSGPAQTGQAPGENGTGTVAQRYLETSSANTAEEMVEMIMTQRAYEANSKAIKASDDMMGEANSIRR